MPGSQVCHYLSDATGSINVVGGDLLWRATKEPADVFWQPEHVVCGEMEQFIITYAPTVDLLEMVQVDMTVRAAARPGAYRRRVIGEVAMRNR